MRRPIVAVLLGFAGGIAIGYAVQIEFEVLVIGAFAVVLTTFFLVVHFKKQKAVWRRGLSLFAVFLFLGGISVTLVEGWPHPLLEEENKRVTVEGVVLSVQEKEEDYFKITLRTEGEKVLVHVAGRPELQGVSWCAKDLMGRKLQVSGLVEKPSERRNPGTFDYRLYLKTRGIYAIIKVKEYDVALPSPQVNFVTHSLAQLKYGFIEKLTQSIDEDTTGMLVGMLFGDKTLIDEDTYEAFQRNGIAHILSVSGIHVGIVYVCINKIFGNRRSWLLTILSISFLLFYAALAEFSPSVVRAVTMIVVHMMSKMAFQRYDLTSCTCACAFGMLVINPFYLFNIGFQLSYLAVLTLGVALPWTNRRIEFLKEGTCPNFLIVALSFIAPLLVIQVGMAPYTAYCFNYFSLAAIVLNIPIIFLAGWVIPVGIVLMGIFVLEGVFLKIPVLAHFLDALFDFTGFIEVLLIDSMDYANTLFYQTGKSFFFVTSPSPFAIMVYYGLLFFLLSEWFRILYQRKQWKRMGKIIGVGLLLSFLLSTLLIKDYSKSNLIFVDVGQGDCLHLRTPGGKNVLIDGGGSLSYDVGEKVLLPYLLKNDVKRVDLAVLTHFHEDHYGGIRSLAKNMEIGKVGCYAANRYRERDILEETGLSKEAMLYLHGGEKIQIEEGVSIEVLYPEKRKEAAYQADILKEEDENKNSLILKVNYEEVSVLMTGDLGFEGEEALLEMYGEGKDSKKGEEGCKLKVDILKIGHHGSKYSTSDSFLTAVNPKVAVFQVGKNNFGHPSKGVIEKCEKTGIMIYRNDTMGAIIVNRGKQWHIETMIKGNTLIKN